MLLLLFLFAVANCQTQLVRYTNQLGSWTFVPDASAPTASGEVTATTVGEVYEIVVLGSASMAMGINASYVENATSLTLVWTLRDVTIMPEVVLSDVIAAVSRGTVIAQISMDIPAAPLLNGVANSTASVIQNYPMGSNDSYGNTILSGHTWGFDYTYFFNTTVENQNVTINSNVFFSFFALW